VPAVNLDAKLAEALIGAATARADAYERRADALEADLRTGKVALEGLEARLRSTEITLAEARGASGLYSKIPAWAALVLAIGTYVARLSEGP
jgi:hypothetical protein